MESTISANQLLEIHGLTTKNKIYEAPAIITLNLSDNIMNTAGTGADGGGFSTVTGS